MRALIMMSLAIGLLSVLLSNVLSTRTSLLKPTPTPPVATEAMQGVSNERLNFNAASSSSGSAIGAQIELHRASNGHFYADVEINGTPVHMLVDTGATGIALSRADAGKAGIATSISMPNVIGEGAEGSIHGEHVLIDRIALGSQIAERVHAVVLDHGEQSLLGQEVLEKFASVEIHGDVMTLRSEEAQT